MNKHGHAAKGSNALVAAVDFYSAALADAITENARLQEQLAGVANQVKSITEEVAKRKDFEAHTSPVIRSAVLWTKAYLKREAPGPSAQEWDRLCVRLCQDVEKFMRMDDRSSMEEVQNDD